MVGILLISTVQDVQSTCPSKFIPLFNFTVNSSLAVLDISSSTECINYSTNKVNITVSCTMSNAPYTPDITLYYWKSGSPRHVPPDTPTQCFDGSDLANCDTNVTKVYNGEIDISEIKSCSYFVVCNHNWDSNTCSNPAMEKTFYFKHCEIFPTIACDNMIPTVYENITVTKTSVSTSTETTTSTVKTTHTETTSIIYCTDDIGSGSCNCSSEPTTSQLNNDVTSTATTSQPNNAESTISTNTIQTVQTNTIASSQIGITIKLYTSLIYNYVYMLCT